MRYILFGGDFYYAKGGYHDIVSCGEGLGELEQKANNNEDLDWWHIYDTSTGNIVKASKFQAHGVDYY